LPATAHSDCCCHCCVAVSAANIMQLRLNDKCEFVTVTNMSKSCNVNMHCISMHACNMFAGNRHAPCNSDLRGCTAHVAYFVHPYPLHVCAAASVLCRDEAQKLWAERAALEAVGLKVVCVVHEWIDREVRPTAWSDHCTIQQHHSLGASSSCGRSSSASQCS
jgi:hypothetical protein